MCAVSAVSRFSLPEGWPGAPLCRLELRSRSGLLPGPEGEVVRCNSCALSCRANPGPKGETWGTHRDLATILVWSNKSLFVDTLV
jgi:hypothetical protein